MCNGCGDCCEVVMLRVRPEDREQSNSVDREWLVNDLVPITWDEAWKRLPALKAIWEDGERPEQLAYRQPYTCNNFDREQRTCAIHERKPACCSGFPWYNREPWFGALDPYPRCAFHADVEQRELHIERGAE
jgi:Fe-S-cluster containining protein